METGIRTAVPQWVCQAHTFDPTPVAHPELQNTRASLSEEDQQKLGALAQDLPSLWKHPRAPWDLKKRILCTVIREVVVYVAKQRLRVLIH